MRLRHASALLLCLAPSLILADEVLNEAHRKQAERRDTAAEQIGPSIANDVQAIVPDAAGAAVIQPVDARDAKAQVDPLANLEKIPGKIGEAGAAAVNALPKTFEELGNNAKDVAGKSVEELGNKAKDVSGKIVNAVKEEVKTNKMSQELKDIPPPPLVEQSSQNQIATGYGSKNVEDVKPADSAKKGAAASDSESDSQQSANAPEVQNAGRRNGAPVADSVDRSKWLVKTMPDTEGKTNLNPPKSKPKSSGGQQSSTTTTTTTTKTSDDDHSNDDHETWHEIFHSFVLSFAMIIFSEIGDKTFLVAALMAMRHTRLLVFSAALSALIAMTVLSAVLGHAFPTLLPKRLTTFAAAILFFVFGAKSLYEGLNMPRDAGIGEEMREVEAELEEKELDMRSRGKGDDDSDSDSDSAGNDPYLLESGRRSANSNFAPRINRPGLGRHAINGGLGARKRKSPASAATTIAGLTNLFSLMLSPAWVQTFIMTFLGEWGDRSQIATIAMAAGQDYWWVCAGSIVGHACCTGLAVIGGRALAGRVSMRMVTIGGAVAFLAFGFIYLYECIHE
ncbi:UPF0016-domain-containing protein [Dissoconium aciculare CBS 342.82]|uniref:UPF0016-domain-containing protein n=1 Tax=Dissoconium aciculare CBS 342.82 TaxID=1314786 RepID=A0A6J3M311_9PEZI|nr:UPF0016-domain-containing protein [Dissoconium aciculare CBS 342.82]KAF1821327.1 UPF0016-domain-containing protein [Dissoconium aciculare CBS 342.82]